jgi:hypothetical protein
METAAATYLRALTPYFGMLEKKAIDDVRMFV